MMTDIKSLFAPQRRISIFSLKKSFFYDVCQKRQKLERGKEKKLLGMKLLVCQKDFLPFASKGK